MVVVRVLAVLVGLGAVAATLVAALKTVVVPRAEVSLITRTVFAVLGRLFRLVASPRRSFDVRDRVMAFYAPVCLLALPVVWVSLILSGFAAILWGTGTHGVGDAFVASGSSLFTLGFSHPAGTGRALLGFAEAGLGLAMVSLLISYLPTIYGAFARREAVVAMLEVRAGTPPSPVEMITRYYRVGWLDGFEDEVVSVWENWFADIEESHTSQPALVHFRSQRPERNWVTAAGCILDVAALVTSTVDRPHDARDDLLMRAGFLALRRIADALGIHHDPNPRPDDPISVERHEYDEVCAQLAATGVPLKADRDQAWRDFAGWRVNYDTVLVALCAAVQAPPAPWSSDRVPR